MNRIIIIPNESLENINKGEVVEIDLGPLGGIAIASEEWFERMKSSGNILKKEE